MFSLAAATTVMGINRRKNEEYDKRLKKENSELVSEQKKAFEASNNELDKNNSGLNSDPIEEQAKAFEVSDEERFEQIKSLNPEMSEEQIRNKIFTEKCIKQFVNPFRNSTKTKTVKSVEIAYTDGTYRKINKGVAIEVLSDEQISLDFRNIEDKDILPMMEALLIEAKSRNLK